MSVQWNENFHHVKKVSRFIIPSIKHQKHVSKQASKNSNTKKCPPLMFYLDLAEKEWSAFWAHCRQDSVDRRRYFCTKSRKNPINTYLSKPLLNPFYVTNFVTKYSKVLFFPFLFTTEFWFILNRIVTRKTSRDIFWSAISHLILNIISIH